MKTVQNNPDARNGFASLFPRTGWVRKVASKSRGLAGESFLMPNQMRAFVNNNRKIMSKLYTQSEMKTIDDVLDMASIVQRDVRDIFPVDRILLQNAAGCDLHVVPDVSIVLFGRGIISKRWFTSELGARIGNHIFGAQNEEAARKILRKRWSTPTSPAV